MAVSNGLCMIIKIVTKIEKIVHNYDDNNMPNICGVWNVEYMWNVETNDENNQNHCVCDNV